MLQKRDHRPFKKYNVHPVGFTGQLDQEEGHQIRLSACVQGGREGDGEQGALSPRGVILTYSDWLLGTR